MQCSLVAVASGLHISECQISKAKGAIVTLNATERGDLKTGDEFAINDSITTQISYCTSCCALLPLSYPLCW